MSGFKSFEELECWKEARKSRNLIKEELINDFPKDELNGG